MTDQEALQLAEEYGRQACTNLDAADRTLLGYYKAILPPKNALTRTLEEAELPNYDRIKALEHFFDTHREHERRTGWIIQ